MADSTKKYKGIKFLKVEHQLFQNVKEFNKKKIIKTISIKDPSPFSRGSENKSLKSYIFEYPLKKEEEKNPENTNSLRDIRKYKSNKLCLFKFQDSNIFKKIKGKDEEKKIGEVRSSKFNSNPKRKILRSSYSCKIITGFGNNLLNNKDKDFSSIKSPTKKNITNSNNLKKMNNSNSKNDKVINNKSKVKNKNKKNNKNNINNKKDELNINNKKEEMNINNKKEEMNINKKKKEININNNEINIINIKNQNTNEIENKEKDKKKENSFKKFFCCL